MNADRDRSERPDLERDLTKLLAADKAEEPRGCKGWERGLCAGCSTCDLYAANSGLRAEVTRLRESRDALIEHNRQLIEERRALLDFRAAVMDDHFGYDPDDPADVQEVLTFMPAWKGEDTARRERLEDAEAALTRVRELADEWLTQYGPSTDMERVFGQQSVSIEFAVSEIRKALDGTD